MAQPELESANPYTQDCVFCPGNGKVEIIRTSPDGNTIFVKVMVKEGDTFVPALGACFVIPVVHFSPDDDLPFDFWKEVRWHIRESGMTFDNEGVNRTREGGAVILNHLHYWLMQAQPGDPPLGLHTLRRKYQEDIAASTPSMPLDDGSLRGTH